jgi:HTH-type transcriptional regulator/antitoxin HigA
MRVEDRTVIDTVASADRLDVASYGRLLLRFVPKVIESEGENEAALAIVESLIEKGDGGRTPEEDAMLDLLAQLVEQFEAKAFRPPEGTPIAALAYLMESNGLKPSDLAAEFGSRGRVSDVLHGRRGISKEQAKRLGARFRVSPAAFI